MIGQVAAAGVWLDRHRELEAEPVRVRLGSMWELAAARPGVDKRRELQLPIGIRVWAQPWPR
jgi:hypothetical protein